jgi:hypothetical protein
LSCWAAIAVASCSTDKVNHAETTVTQQALSGASLITTPTSFRSYAPYPELTEPAGVYAEGGSVASFTRGAVEMYAGFDLSALPSDATVDGVTVRLVARRTRADSCDPSVTPGLFVGPDEYPDSDPFPELWITTTDLQPVTYTVHPNALTGSLLKSDGLGIALGYFRAPLPAGCRLEIDYLQVTLAYHHECPAGTWWNQGICSPCDTSCATCDNAGATSCRSCAAGKYLNLNADSLSGACADCGSPTCGAGESLSACGPYKPTTCEACPDCGPYEYVSSCNGTSSVCAYAQSCGPGQRVKTPYTSRRDQACTSCPDGTYNPDVYDMTDCFACPAGQWSDRVPGDTGGPTECYELPLLFGIGPASGVSEGGDSVTLIGARFAPTAKVLFGMSEASSVVVRSDGRQITVRTPGHALGRVDVTVDNNDGHLHAMATLKDGFTYQGAAIPLSLATISPASGSIAGGTQVTITGGGFVIGSTTVQFDGVLAETVTVVASDRLTAVSPAHAKGAVQVVVINGRGGMGTLSKGFTYTESPPPSDVDAGVDDAATSTSTGTGTTATNTVTGTATSAVAVATSTVVATTNTGTATSAVASDTATSVGTTGTGVVTATSATNTDTLTSATATDTGTRTKTDASTGTSVATSTVVDAGVDVVFVADGSVDSNQTGGDGGASDAAAVPSIDATTHDDVAVPSTDAATVSTKSDSGCSCDVGSSAHSNGGVILLILGSVLVVIRRKWPARRE